MARPTRPTRQVCPLCATDDDVELQSDGPDLWSFICRRGHPTDPFTWSPTATVAAASGRVGLAEDLGVYDELLPCVGPTECVEYGILEYRFAQAAPDSYRQLVAIYGHASLSPTKYSASSFLAHAASQLAREGLLEQRLVAGTGYWAYLSRVSAWAVPGNNDVAPTSWAAYAASLGLDAGDWSPTLGLA